MAAQKGRDLLLRVDQDGNGSSFTTVAGLRANSIAFNAETVDATSADSAGAWRELLAGAGLRHAAIRGSGIFLDAAADELIRSLFFAAAIRSWQILLPAFGTVSGKFQITALEYGGRHDGEMTFELALESAGPLSFTASA